MDTIRYALFCEYGMLCHGATMAEIKKEKELFRNHTDKDFRIESYDFQTHEVTNGGIVPREVPLTFYSAEDLFKIAPLRTDHSLWRSLNQMFPEIHNFYNKNLNNTRIETRIIYDSEDVSLLTFWFEEDHVLSTPFMICQFSGEDDNFTRFITDNNCYYRVLDYLRSLSPHDSYDVIDPKEKLIELTCFGYHEIINFDRKR